MKTVLGVSVGTSHVRMAYPLPLSPGQRPAADTFDYNVVDSTYHPPFQAQAEFVAESVGSMLDSAPHISATAITYRMREQAEALRAAMARQQLTNYELVPEPLAAIEYLVASGEIGGYNTIALLDLGQSGLNVEIVDAQTRTIRYGEYTAEIAGNLFDARIRDFHIQSGFITPPTDNPGYVALDDRCRQAKEQLSYNPGATLPTDTGMILFNRETFESMVTPDLDAASRLVIGILERSEQKPQAIVLLGGGARMPLFRTVLSRWIGAPIIVPNEPDTVTARGAVLLAKPVVQVPQQPAGNSAPASGFVPTVQIPRAETPATEQFVAQTPASAPPAQPQVAWPVAPASEASGAATVAMSTAQPALPWQTLNAQAAAPQPSPAGMSNTGQQPAAPTPQQPPTPYPGQQGAPAWPTAVPQQDSAPATRPYAEQPVVPQPEPVVPQPESPASALPRPELQQPPAAPQPSVPQQSAAPQPSVPAPETIRLSSPQPSFGGTDQFGQEQHWNAPSQPDTFGFTPDGPAAGEVPAWLSAPEPEPKKSRKRKRDNSTTGEFPAISAAAAPSVGGAAQQPWSTGAAAESQQPAGWGQQDDKLAELTKAVAAARPNKRRSRSRLIAVAGASTLGLAVIALVGFVLASGGKKDEVSNSSSQGAASSFSGPQTTTTTTTTEAPVASSEAPPQAPPIAAPPPGAPAPGAPLPPGAAPPPGAPLPPGVPPPPAAAPEAPAPAPQQPYYRRPAPPRKPRGPVAPGPNTFIVPGLPPVVVPQLPR